MKRTFAAALVAVASLAFAQLAVQALTPIATVTFAPITEMSGIVKSRRYPGVYWVHNDSGDEARFFAIRADGSVVAPPWMVKKDTSGKPGIDPAFGGIRLKVASNEDWEDVASDGDTLYFCDVGNNGNARRDLGIYAVAEPNPEAVDSTRPLAWYPVAYEDQKDFPPKVRHYDCEAVFWLKGKLYFVTKHRRPDGRVPELGANLYVMDTWFTDRTNKLRKVDSAANLGGWVTAADISPDGKTVAVLTHFPQASVWLFPVPANGDRILSQPGRQIKLSGVDQDEGVCWDGPDSLLVTNEQRQIFRVPVAR